MKANVVLKMIPHELANILWPFGKVEKKDEGVFEASGGRAIEESVLQRMIPQALANILWAYGKLRRRTRECLRRLGNERLG